MSSDKKKAKQQKQRQWEKENESVTNFRSQAPQLKPFLRSKGCDLPFYDFLDSYSDEFQRIVTEAKGNHPSLLDVLVAHTG